MNRQTQRFNVHPVMSIMLLSIACIVLATPAHADTELRVATYNIKYLDSADLPSQGDRATKLMEIIAALEADVIALQEIDDRDALELIFNPDDWWLIIDEDSGSTQDLAFAVTRSLNVAGITASDQDAEDDDFLFSDLDNYFFPNRRDVLAITIDLPNENTNVVVMNVHQKSRYGGRTLTDIRREDAARQLIAKLESEFDDRNFILLGDFNDTPDDRCMNILETGDPQALAGPEQILGPFLINLTEPLWTTDHVTHGRKSNELNDDKTKIDLINTGARQLNNDTRGFDTDDYIDIMFDQLLIPATMIDAYVEDSIAIYDGPHAAVGNNATRASDHLPVYADFVFHGIDSSIVVHHPDIIDVQIVALLANPNGTDSGNETITIANHGPVDLNLINWRFRDRADNEYVISNDTMFAANSELQIVMTVASMPLNNGGDEVELLDAQGNVVSRIEYTANDVHSGVELNLR